MIKYKLILAIAVFVTGCKTETKKETVIVENSIEEIAPITDSILESAVIYEANIRQYSPEGTFNAFTRDIPQLKELGVKIIWLMPVFPISEVKRKAFGDKMVEDIDDASEREKYLGSYYAVSDFRKINPEFGTIEDFRKLLKTAHENDIYVILDWVPNHTGWDHTWITQHPDFYTKNSEGEITDPLNDDGTPVGWEDVADLNYDNMEMREAMIADMMYWVEEEGIDGFRCDMAGMVPTDFWADAIPKLRSAKDIFMLAEWEDPQLTRNNLFEMAYGWEVHHLLNAIAKEEKGVRDFDNYMNHSVEKWKNGGYLMNFLTNHDENSWAGSVSERMGDASEAMLALVYCMPGMPLIYSGQEYDLDHRLKFFEKDSIPKEKGKVWPVLKKLGELKNTIPALSGAKNQGEYTRLQTSPEDVLAFKREKNSSELIYVANMSTEEREVVLPLQGKYLESISGNEIEINPNNSILLGPWQYRILVKM
ncbi:MAG: alpha-amylase [Bacteroidia bacterium]|nr:alpha-amylase [Bacteroidia bacterium]NNF31253.1 alpha-amylase [Flavobacteriaceae bacterium]MBT8275879.1 alpha-amylase [Bacteroidia bacterium]NNJ82938.1 alpha-amylase [Flavobacteriaceae bacterium]NNK54552.1 alpha-amylase [Flavobacteriaceae bacterium]